ncbi:protein ALTERED PHOSPHATE STARVATION RESPONSE 1-like [Zingiber officinale]|uniref:protein ALTERED PHOSPHATE STARVATION RESPONSE 1-like n=1 Tax=Zingiber officinale TaxID=94328 RepID=UPI001C4D54A7|nr:protein ALTERED PHOSPHATE STARVATION RESPONSE 1-like [Zingiber officinale]
MGCAQSRIENEEAVVRCKERRQWMKSAVSARNAFAAAHSAYAVQLKNVGAALGELGQGESYEPNRPSSSSSAAAESSASVAPIQPPTDAFLPPPPPPTEFSAVPIQRSRSMPDLPNKLPSKIKPEAAIREDDDEGEEEAEADDEEEEEEEEEERGTRLKRRHRTARATAGFASPSPPPPVPSPPPPYSTPPPLPTDSNPNGMENKWDFWSPMDHTMLPPSLDPLDAIRSERPDAPDEKLNTPSPAPRTANHHDDEPLTPEKDVSEPPLPPKVPKKLKQGRNVHHQHAQSASTLDAKRGEIILATRPSVSLSKVLLELDDHFLKASESTHDVLKMLEATRMHYHSNFADSRGHIDHSARVMRVITWNRSFKGVSGTEGKKDDFDDDDDKWETHATVLDKILAWEKKLYDEVKAGELMKIEYQWKAALLQRQNNRGASTETLERTKAVVSHLQTRLIVDMQSVDSTVFEIERLRDKQLYPKLVDLVDGMAKMWQVMHKHHSDQLKIVNALDISNAPKETSEVQYKRTLQLFRIVKAWHTHFCGLVSYQKEYVTVLNSWLKLSVIPIETGLKDKEKVSSSHRPPIQPFVHTWHDHLQKIPHEPAANAIQSFSAVIDSIRTLQDEEIKQKEKREEMHREYLRKNRAFEDWYHKHEHKMMKSTVGAPESAEGTTEKDQMEERRSYVQSLKTTLEGEVEVHRRLLKQVREKTATSLKTHLPELFRAMSEFADFCTRMYTSLKLIADQSQQHTHSPA